MLSYVKDSVSCDTLWLEYDEVGMSLMVNQPDGYGGSNNSGFTAYPGGYRDGSGYFYAIGTYACWWSATDANLPDTNYRHAFYCLLWGVDGEVELTHAFKGDGMNVRCVMD